MRSRKILLAASILPLLAVFGQEGPHLPNPQGMVSDYAGKLSPATKRQLENLLVGFRDRSRGIEVAIVLMPHSYLGGLPIEDYALELGRAWGVGGGQDKAGLLLLVAIRDPDERGRYSGQTRLEVSRQLEGDIPDGLAGEIIRRMSDDLRAGRFDQAITAAAQTILATLAEKRGISLEGIESQYAYKAPARRSRPYVSTEIIFAIMIMMAILIMIGILVMASMYGRRGFQGIFYRSSSDFVGFGSGGDFGGGDFGGFGSGGDFGGGGASDSW
jgi:uncharacterized protein